MRMQIRRLTRLTNGFGKKLESHRAAIALHFAYYNFCRIHGSLRVTPAMEAGTPITSGLWRNCCRSPRPSSFRKLLEGVAARSGMTLRGQ